VALFCLLEAAPQPQRGNLPVGTIIAGGAIGKAIAVKGKQNPELMGHSHKILRYITLKFYVINIPEVNTYVMVTAKYL